MHYVIELKRVIKMQMKIVDVHNINLADYDEDELNAEIADITNQVNDLHDELQQLELEGNDARVLLHQL